MVLWDKPAGPSSHQALGILKRTFGTRRVGHAGTLDPPATGLLVCAVGKATRLLQDVEAREKEYLFAVRFGTVTTTLDTAGEVIVVRPVPDLGAVDWNGLLAGFTGVLSQVPPAVSAIKVDGVRAYDRVRQGEEVELAARSIEVHRFVRETELEASMPGIEPRDLLFRVNCSKGTYVRSLARDLGELLGCGACVSLLRRTAIGPWRVPDVPSETPAEPRMQPVERFFSEWPRFPVDLAGREALCRGKAIESPLPDAALALAIGDEALATGRVVAGQFHPEVLLVDAR
jgi:tRNA pseudouridine55 synthase